MADQIVPFERPTTPRKPRNQRPTDSSRDVVAGLLCNRLKDGLDGLENLVQGMRVFEDANDSDQREQLTIMFEGVLCTAIANLQAVGRAQEVSLGIRRSSVRTAKLTTQAFDGK